MGHQSMMPGGKGRRGSGRGGRPLGCGGPGSTRHQPTLQGRSASGGHAPHKTKSGGNRRSDCFITTACAQARGLPDDCEQLRLLRLFRDGYVADLPDGAEILAEYDAKAPRIVAAIRELPPALAEIVWGWIFEQIDAAVALIRGWRFASAYRLYAEACMELDAVLLGNAERDDDPRVPPTSDLQPATQTAKPSVRKETRVEA